MRAIPIVPLILGLSGLLPFWGLAVALAAGGAFGFDPRSVDVALATYAALIISFLGGIRWGLAVPSTEDRNLVASVIPCLLAWALLAAPEPWRLAGLAALALLLGPIDARMVGAGLAPPWFGRLRLILSAGAGVALLLGAWSAASS